MGAVSTLISRRDRRNDCKSLAVRMASSITSSEKNIGGIKGDQLATRKMQECRTIL